MTARQAESGEDSGIRNRERILQYLGVLAEPAPAIELATLIGGGTDETEAVLRSLVAEGILRAFVSPAPAADRFGFADAGEAAVAVSTVATSARREMHRAASSVSVGRARWRHIVAASEAPDDSSAAQLALIAAQETDPIQAAEYFLWCGELSSDAEQRARHLCEAVRLLVLGGQEDEGLQYEAQVRALTPSARRSETLALLRFAQSRLAEARNILHDAITASSGRAEPDLAQRLHVELGLVSATLGLGGEARHAAQQALTDPGDPLLDDVARAVLASGTALIGGAAAGLAVLDDLPVNASACRSSQLPQLATRGILRGLMGRLDEAAADLEVAAARRDSSFGALLGAAPIIHLAWCRYMLGDWERALSAVHSGLDPADRHRRSFDTPLLHSLAAIIHAGRGEKDSAVRHLAKSEEGVAQADYRGPSVHLRVARAALAQADSDHMTVAGTLSGITGATVESDRLTLYSVWWLPALAHSQIVLGRYVEAGASLRAIGDLPERGAWGKIAHALVSARLAEARGTMDLAEVAYRAGMDARADGGDPLWYRALLMVSYGQFLLAAADRQRARQVLERACQLLRRIGAVPFLERCERELARANEPDPLDWRRQLTAREWDVSELVGQGMTNAEIGSRLFVSAKTVEYHLGNVFMKLQIPNRQRLRDKVRAVHSQ